MSTFNEYTKKMTVRSLIFVAVFLSMMIMQPGFINMAYSGVADKDAALDRGKDSNNAGNTSVVAELNGVPISTLELLKRYNLFLIMSGTVESSGDRVPVNSYLDSYLVERLLLQEAKKMGISVNRNEVEQEKKKYLDNNDLKEDAFLKSLSGYRLSIGDVDQYFKNNLVITRFGNKKFGSRDITEEEVRKNYAKNKDYFNRPEKIALSHILICHQDSNGCASDLDKKQAKTMAENIRKLATPANFAQLAKQFSTDRTRTMGGDLGYIKRGEAVPSIEEAAFKLGKGEISEVVETEFGYHIIFVREKQKALSMTFEEARDIIKENLKENYIASRLFRYSEQLLQTASIKRFTPDLTQGVEGSEINTKNRETVKKVSADIKKFRTFKNTGKEANVNSKGKPVILLFTSIGCSHCQWISETFDTTVMEYVKNGLIEAHHYEMDTSDDLLTPVHESEIPPEYLKVKDEMAPDSVPYFNFGGRYDRIGTGYEAQDDFFAEEMEMRQVIDSLLSK